MTNYGSPTPPVALPTGRVGRLVAPQVEVSDAVRASLVDTGATIDTTPDELADHGRDWWPLSIGWALHDGVVPSMPGVIVRPHTTSQVSAVVGIANEHRIPLTTMAGRSGVCGASIPVHGGIALDMTGLDGIVGVDDESLTIDVLAGTFGDVLEDRLRTEHAMTLGHWPQSIALSTVGGWLACRSAGQYSTRYGKIEDMVRGLEVVLADGSVLTTGNRGPREAAGPDLTQLLVGSEGTLGVITRAQLQVWPQPAAVRKAAFGFSSFAAGLDVCRRILRSGATPAVLRLYDERESARTFGTPKPGSAGSNNVLLILDEGQDATIGGGFLHALELCGRAGAVGHDPSFVDTWLGHRNDVSQLESIIRNDIVIDTIEIAAPWAPLAAIHADVTEALLAVPGTLLATCHQSHAYADGACLYFTFAGRPDTDLESREAFYIACWDTATRITLARGGAVSHHHGIGLHRGRYLAEALGQAGFSLLATIKRAMDPNGILNPGKLGLPDPFGALEWP